MALCFVERELLPIEGLQYWNRDFSPLGSCDLDLDPITFKYTLDPYPLEIYRMSENELLRQGFRKISYYKHTYNYRQIGLYRYYRNTYTYAPPKLCTTPRASRVVKNYRLKWCYCENTARVLYAVTIMNVSQTFDVNVRAVHTIRVQGPWTRVVNPGVWNDPHEPVNTGTVWTGARVHGPCSPMSQTSTVIPWTRPVNTVVILDVRFHGPWIWDVNMGSVDRCAMFFNTANAVVCGD